MADTITPTLAQIALGVRYPISGDDFKTWRQAMHWTQSDAASFLRLSEKNGRFTVRRWETGEYSIPYTVAVAIHYCDKP